MNTVMIYNCYSLMQIFLILNYLSLSNSNDFKYHMSITLAGFNLVLYFNAGDL